MFPALFPEAHIFRPDSGEPTLGWGILAPGTIATAFASALRTNTAQRLVAVASRSRPRADAFAARFNAARAYDSYDALVTDHEVDVVYVASPASHHLELGLLAIAAGKHVLIEKPLATTARDAQTLIDAARAQGTFLMEAMWSRYLPQASVIRTLLADGVIGEPRGVLADHWQAAPNDPTHRLYRPELGGGALLDLGIYPLQLDSMVLGSPRTVTATGALTESGVDAYATVVLGHGPGVQSTVSTSILARSTSGASIIGSAGRIILDGPSHAPTNLTLLSNDLWGPRAQWLDPTGISHYGGLSWQATAAAHFIGEGRTESPLHRLQEVAEILGTIDEVRRQIVADGRTLPPDPSGASRWCPEGPTAR